MVQIKVSQAIKIKNLKKLSRETVGLPRGGQKILPKKGGPYKRRTKYKKTLLSE